MSDDGYHGLTCTIYRSGSSIVVMAVILIVFVIVRCLYEIIFDVYNYNVQ